jgi:hypothetical protein
MDSRGMDAGGYSAWVLRSLGEWGVGFPVLRSPRLRPHKEPQRRESIVMASVEEQTDIAVPGQEFTGRGLERTLSGDRDYLDWLENHRAAVSSHGLGRRIAGFCSVLAALMAALGVLKVR